MIRRLARVSAGVIAALTLLLLVDWAVATSRAPKDEKLIKDIQETVKNDASFAPKLAAEQKRVTDYRKSRKRRDNWIANGLITAAIVFLVCARRNLPRHIPAPPPRAAHRAGTEQKYPCPRRALAVDEAIDLAFVDEAVARIGRGREASIPLLQAIQTHYRYLPDEALRRLCEITEITPAQIAGTSSFYGQFRRSPVGEHIVKVCHGTACHVSGARQITDELRRYLAIQEGQDTDASRQFTIEEAACLGCCSLAPVLMVDEHTAGRLTPNAAPEALRPFEKEPA
ncbi:MAG TPA: NAD(P)H-dependent oxidoreductase subunit E [Bryobacteraceae bacterium]|nr:NAD(P)H-dependent oxidoreductase subunit E [Bryobacteraceae bacterium]